MPNEGLVKPALYPGTAFAAIAGRVALVNGSRSVMLPNERDSQWLQALQPYLDGDHTVAELTSGLDGTRLRHVKGLVRCLLETGFARDASLDAAHGLTPEERTRHKETLDYIAASSDSPARRLEIFLRSGAYILGSGPYDVALLSALSELGILQSDRVDLDDLSDLKLRPYVAQDLTPTDVVINADDHMPLNVLGALATRFARSRTLFITVARTDGVGWICPYLSPTACIRCAIQTAWETSILPTARDVSRRPQTQRHAPSRPTVHMLAGLTAFEAFLAMTRCSPALRGARTALSVNLETLETIRYTYTPDPDCTACSQRRRRSKSHLTPTVV